MIEIILAYAIPCGIILGFFVLYNVLLDLVTRQRTTTRRTTIPTPTAPEHSPFYYVRKEALAQKQRARRL